MQRRARPPRYTFVLLAALMLTAGCGGEDLGGPKMEPMVETIVPAAAAAMGEVTSVRFDLERSGAVVYIDTVDSLSLDTLAGRFAAPHSADAVLEVTVDGSLSTKLGAVAIGETVWLSNPVTGLFETLPPGMNIDPSRFFDPKKGWQPLFETLKDAEFVAEESRDGTRYHIRGVAPAAQIEIVTAGLVRDQDVEVDFWIHPVSGLVTSAEFSTEYESEITHWQPRPLRVRPRHRDRTTR